MISDATRKTEVNIKHCTPEDRQLMGEAKDNDVYQWNSNSVCQIVRNTGIAITRSMAMGWIKTWKEAPKGTRAKARLVAKGFLIPDLLTV